MRHDCYMSEPPQKHPGRKLRASLRFDFVDRRKLRRDPSLPMNFVNRRKLILWVTFAGRRDDDAGRIVNSSGAGVYLFYRERQPAKRGARNRVVGQFAIFCQELLTSVDSFSNIYKRLRSRNSINAFSAVPLGSR